MAGLSEELNRALLGQDVRPCPPLDVIVKRPFHPALRARPPEPLGVFNPNIDLLLINDQLDLADRPGVFDAEQMLLQGGIEHNLPPFWKQILSRPATHRKPGRPRSRSPAKNTQYSKFGNGDNRSLRCVYLFRVLSFFTPMAKALFIPTMTTSFLPRVTPV